MTNLPVFWVERLFYCVDVGIGRLMGAQASTTSHDPSFATGVLTTLFVVGGTLAIELIGRIFGADGTGRPPGTNWHETWQDPAIILACAAVWLLVSARCVYRGAREEIHHRFDLESATERRLRSNACLAFILIVFVGLPLALRIVR
jgi:hypothetical protein